MASEIESEESLESNESEESDYCFPTPQTLNSLDSRLIYAACSENDSFPNRTSSPGLIVWGTLGWMRFLLM